MLSDADRAPVAVGVKVTLIVQLELPADVLPQLFVSAKSPAFDPTIEIAVIATAVELTFVSVTGAAELVVPTF